MFKCESTSNECINDYHQHHHHHEHRHRTTCDQDCHPPQCPRQSSPTMASKSLSRVLLSSLVLLSVFAQLAQSMSCDEARIKCLFRSGCGFALQSYMVECADLIAGHSKHCNPRCERALIALASSDGGTNLINCECASDSEYCSQSKQRIEVCRAAVFRALEKDSIVSCTTARWVCMADPLCSTALDYYHHFCAKLFYGHHCNHRCNNSLSILNRQVNAQKLRTCFCDGTEDFPCKLVKYNTQKYCYGIVTPVVHFVDSPELSEQDNSEQNRIRRLEQIINKLDDSSMVGGYKRHKHRYYNRAGDSGSSTAAHLSMLMGSMALGLVIGLAR